MSTVSVYDFRANEECYTQEELMGFLHKLGKKFVFQLEKGESGYMHWQGRLSLWKPKRKPELMKLMKSMEMLVPNYLSPTTNSEYQKVAFYCLKEDTRIDGPWRDTDKVAYIPRQYRGFMDNLYPFQKSILDSRDIFETRSVDCVICPHGGEGKSTVASLAELYKKGYDLPTVNDAQMLINMTCDLLIKHDDREPGLLFFDMPRSQSKEKLYGLFSAVEQIKKGKVYDPRYSYKTWWFDSPRIWIFMNSDPDVTLLTRDRWRFWTINEDKELVHYEPQEVTTFVRPDWAGRTECE